MTIIGKYHSQLEAVTVAERESENDPQSDYFVLRDMYSGEYEVMKTVKPKNSFTISTKKGIL